MKLKATKDFLDKEHGFMLVKKDSEIECEEDRAKDLIELGVAEEIETKPKKKKTEE